MEELVFWKKWSVWAKVSLYVAMVLTIAAIIFYVSNFSVSLESLVEWEIKQKVETVSVTMDSFQRNLIEYPVEIQNYLVSNEFHSKAFGIPLLASRVYLAFLVIALTLLLTAMSSIKKSIWFALSMTFVIAYLAFLDLDYIGGGIFQIGDKIFSVSLIIGLVLLVGPVVAFNMFFENTKVGVRAIVIALSVLAFGAYVFATSQIHNPYLAITNNGVIVPIVVTMIFIFMVSYDIISTITSVVSYSKSASGMSNVYNVIVGAFLYLLNLLLWFLDSRNVVDWNLMYFNPFALLVISAILGIWGHKRRSVLFQKIIDVNPYGMVIYFGLMTIALSTIAYMFITVNEGVLKFLEDNILVAHLFVGGHFLIYVYFNFVDDLKLNKPIYKMMYKPKNMKYMFVRFAAILAVLVLFLKEDFIQKRYLIAGIRSLKGDVEFAEGNLMGARIWYKKTNNTLIDDLKTNYYLSSLYKLDGQKNQSLKHLKNLQFRKSAPFVYVLMAQNFKNDADHPYQDLLILQEGVQRFPESEYLNFTVANTFERYQLYDSAQYYYNRVLELVDDNQSDIYTNLLSVYVKAGVVEEAQDQLAAFDVEGNAGFATNLLACSNVLNKNLEMKLDRSFFADSIIEEVNGAYANNYFLNSIYQDTVPLKELEYVSGLDKNGANWETWTFLKGVLHSYDFDSKKSADEFNALNDNVFNNFRPYYDHLAGILMYKQGAQKEAQEFWRISSQVQQYKTLNNSPLYYMMLRLKELGKEEAIETLQALQVKDPSFVPFCNDMLKVFEWSDFEELFELEEPNKYHALVMNTEVRQHPRAEELLASIEWDELKNLAIVELVNQCVDEGDVTKAERFWVQHGGEVNTEILTRLNFAYLRLLNLTGKYDELLTQTETVRLSKAHDKYRAYFVARAYFEKGNVKEAEKQLTILRETIPETEEVDLLIVDIMMANQKIEEAYNKVIEYLQDYPQSILLNQRYCELALQVNMSEYGENNLKVLKELMSADAYAKFEARFYQLVKITENEDLH